jgi:hypothetical protein
MTIATCALFGFRPERDQKGYYRHLLNDLADRSDVQIVAATNDPSQLSPRIRTVQVDQLDPWADRIWNVSNRDETVRRLAGWHSSNKKRDLYQQPHLVGVYLAKIALWCEIARQVGPCVWLDAGLVFSVCYDHDVPQGWKGYDAELLRERFIPYSGSQSEPVLTHFSRRRRWFQEGRPHFHGMSYRAMDQLAHRSGAKPDDRCAAAAVMVMPGGRCDEFQDEFREVWHRSVEMGQIGTEENVLTVQRWKHGWKSHSHDEWLSMLRR